MPGKCIYENEDKLDFVAFWGEGFRGGKSDTLIKFYEKYPQEDLNKDEKYNSQIYFRNYFWRKC